MNINGRVNMDFSLSTSGTNAVAIANKSPVDVAKTHNERKRKIRSRGLCITKVSSSKNTETNSKNTTMTLIENSRKPAVITAEIG